MGKEDGTKPKVMYWLMLLVPLFWGGAFATAKHVITEIPRLSRRQSASASPGFSLRSS